MYLTLEERAWANGAGGPAKALAIELLIAAGRVLGAERLRPIAAAYVNTTFSASPAHLDLLEKIAAYGARAAVPTYTNIAGMAEGDGRMGPAARDLAETTARLLQLHRDIGAHLTLTCAPYQLPGVPSFGEHVACSESNAVAYFNSVLGVRTAKYGDYLDLAAALVGRVPDAGLHTDAGRLPEVRLTVRLPGDAFGDGLTWVLLGLCMGEVAGTRVVFIDGPMPQPSGDDLRALGASGATWGGVALFHLDGVTPDAERVTDSARAIEPRTVGVAELEAVRERISGFDSGPVDAVVVGTPHASVDESRSLAALLAGRKVAANTALFLQLNRFTAALLEADGNAAALRASGVTVVQNTCLYWPPAPLGLSGNVMTTSGKFAHYSAGDLGLRCRLASLVSCVESAVAGQVVEAGRGA